jgi:hypothetical protein
VLPGQRSSNFTIAVSPKGTAIFFLNLKNFLLLLKVQYFFLPKQKNFNETGIIFVLINYIKMSPNKSDKPSRLKLRGQMKKAHQEWATVGREFPSGISPERRNSSERPGVLSFHSNLLF